ncbi:uncharacterized protein [Ptychodera flava]|uniref:uncharacterized protein isoform X2 n=1 Tax=Ptychodera flava TaxID=63121 RepID=UPI00396A3FDF
MRFECSLIVFFMVAVAICQADKRYEVNPDCQTWRGASSMCGKRGGRLASIPDDVTHSQLVSLITERGFGHIDFWFDAHDISAEGDWSLFDGTRMSYHNWAEGEPNNYGDGRCGGNQDCAKLWSKRDNFLWDDESCCQENGYICEYTDEGMNSTSMPPTVTSLEVSKSVSQEGKTTFSKQQTSSSTLSGNRRTGKPEAAKNTQPESNLETSFIERAVVLLLALSVINFIVLVVVVMVVYQFVWKKVNRCIISEPRYQDLVNQHSMSEIKLTRIRNDIRESSAEDRWS